MEMDGARRREIALVGGGCFWCLEAVFEALEGVLRVTSGYGGGVSKNPTYREVCEGGSGHIEVVEVVFDPDRLTYQQVLEVFFAIHDPTSLDRQGYDTGIQYRSVIFAQNDAQATIARAVITELEAALGRRVVTELRPSAVFWPAEQEHQEYFRRHPEQAYCRAVIHPKLTHFRARFAALVR